MSIRIPELRKRTTPLTFVQMRCRPTTKFNTLRLSHIDQLMPVLTISGCKYPLIYILRVRHRFTLDSATCSILFQRDIMGKISLLKEEFEHDSDGLISSKKKKPMTQPSYPIPWKYHPAVPQPVLPRPTSQSVH